MPTLPFPGTDDCIKMYLNGTRSHTTCKHMSHATTAILATGYSYEHCTRGWYIIIWPSLAPQGGITPVVASLLLVKREEVVQVLAQSGALGGGISQIRWYSSQGLTVGFLPPI